METYSFIKELKSFKYKLKFKLFIQLTAIILSINLFYILTFIFFPYEDTSSIFTYIPIFNPFIHSDLEHLMRNLIFLGLVLISDINSDLGLPKLIKLSFLISFILFPFVLFHFTQPMVGISGLCYLLFSRILVTRKQFPKLYFLLFLFLLIFEIKSIGNHDNISHLCHFLGIIIGFFSVTKNKCTANYFKTLKSVNKYERPIC
jgi:membrane associated rhomboid family serine protease